MRTLVLPLGLAAILLSPFFVLGQPPDRGLTLERAQALAGSRSFAVSAAQREVDAADGALQQAGAYPNPQLNASVQDTNRATRETTATLDFAIERGGKRGARQVAAQRARDLASADLASARAQLRSEVLQAFFGVLIAQEQVVLTTRSAELATRAAALVGRRVLAGKVSPVDETRAGVDQANAALEAAEASAALQGARQALAALWGDADLADARVDGDIESLPLRPTPAELASELDAAPALVSARAEQDRRRALVYVERSKGVPDLRVSVGATRDNELGRTRAIVGVSIPLPFFDRNEGGVIEAARRADKAGDEVEATRLRARTELQQASTQLALARRSAQLLKESVLPAAQQAHESATRGFEAGKFGFLDVLDAQRSLLQARARYLAAVAASNQAASAIDRVLGR